MIYFDNSYIDYAFRIVVALCCGVVLGFERKTRRHAVGMRTLSLISVSSCMLAMLSSIAAQLPNTVVGDPTRVTAGIVTGIGFMGAGAILHQGINIRGLTSAAVIWTSSALGIACGTGQIFLAGITLVVSVASLLIFEKIEYKLFPAEKSKSLKIICAGNEVNLEKIQQEINASGLIQRDLNITKSLENNRTELKFSVNTHDQFNMSLFAEKIMQIEEILEISIGE